MTGRVGRPRNIFLVWLLWPIITLGIYHVVWWYKINREARDLDADIEVSPALAVVAITLGALIIIPPWVSIFKTGERIGRMQSAAGLPATCSGLLGLIASFSSGCTRFITRTSSTRSGPTLAPHLREPSCRFPAAPTRSRADRPGPPPEAGPVRPWFCLCAPGPRELIGPATTVPRAPIG